jgi:hypothetical protein
MLLSVTVALVRRISCARFRICVMRAGAAAKLGWAGRMMRCDATAGGRTRRARSAWLGPRLAYRAARV